MRVMARTVSTALKFDFNYGTDPVDMQLINLDQMECEISAGIDANTNRNSTVHFEY